MKEIAVILEEEGIKWTLSGGSILGAVRHKGFIPWDDDIDVFMTREEFEKAWNDLSADDPEECPAGEENEPDEAASGDHPAESTVEEIMEDLAKR